MTVQGNIDWKILSGNQIKGEQINTNKLKEEDVLRIKELKEKYTQKEIAKMFGVTQGNVGHILRGLTWKHL